MLGVVESYADRIIRLFGARDAKAIAQARIVTFQVTEDCNMACTYCYQTHKTKNRMPLEVAKRTIDMLFAADERTNKYIDFNKLEALNLDFIGGEPLLEIELIDKIMDYYLETAIKYKSKLAYRYMISMSSNGTLYFKDEVQRFIKKWGNHLSLNFSIDGNKALHDECRVFPDGSGTYDLAVSAAKDYMKGHALSTKMTFAPENIKHVSGAIKGLVETGYKMIFCNCVFEKGWTLDNAKVYYAELIKAADYLLEHADVMVSVFNESFYRPIDPHENKNWCGGGMGLMLAVDYKGNFFPCLRFMESSLNGEHEPYIIGDSSGIIVNEKHEERLNCLNCLTRSSQSTEECFYCEIASGCAWCSAYNYQVFGTINKRATFICDMFRAQSLANVYYWNKRYRKFRLPNRFTMHLKKESALRIISESEYNMLLGLTKEI